MNYFLQLAFLLVMTLTFSCQGDKTEAQKFDSTNKNVVVKTTNDRVLGVARIEPKEGIINLVAGASGKILDVMIEDNMTIQKGQTLLLLDQSVENSQLQQAKSKITPQKVAVSAQKANVETVRTRLKNAKEVMKRNQELYTGNAITKQALDESRYLVEQLEKELSAAESLVTQANSRISELETDITYYETILNQKKVKATQNGKILKVSVKRGEYAQNDKVIAEFAPEGPLVAKTEIDEIYAERIKTGQKAIILSQTSGDTLARGTVFFAADYLKAKSLFKDQSTELEDRRIREVHIKIEEGQKPLIGSRVDCIILLN
jgi:multidrug resistance efflux pump